MYTYLLLSIVDSFPGQFLVEKLVGVVEDECFKKNMMPNVPRKYFETESNGCQFLYSFWKPVINVRKLVHTLLSLVPIVWSIIN